MSRIRGRNTIPEKMLMTALHKRGLCFCKHYRLPGKPDIVFRDKKIAIFINGCFWHGCPRCFVAPKSNRRFWRAKIEANRKRDVRTARLLRRSGWSVLNLWEHEILKNPDRCADRILRKISSVAR